jgi:tRNA(Ile)-lysidine synthase
VRFDALQVGPLGSSAPFARELNVPGSVPLPEGGAIRARPWPGDRPPLEGAALIPARGALTVRNRRPGDHARRSGREVSLKRLLLDRRVPADRRDALPLVASGHDVLWGPGLGIDAPAARGGAGLVLLEIEMNTGVLSSVERG